MAKIISKCPRGETTNIVSNTIFMRGDNGTCVVCSNCALRFRAVLSKEDEKALFKSGSIFPIVIGKNDYILKSTYYPNP